MAGIWVDVVLAVLIAAAVVRGWRAGGVLETLTLGGFWLGMVVGFLAAPLVAKAASGAARTAVLLAWFVVAALAGGVAGQLVGARLRQKVRRGRLAAGDKVLGAGVGALATAAALWLVGTLLAASAPVWLSRPLQQSSILTAMDTVMPDPPTLFARVESLFNQAGFPIVVVNLPPGLTNSQPLPTSAEVLSAASAVRASMVKVTGEACGLFQSGSGFVAQRGVVVTNAHVVAGETRTTVSDGAGVYGASVISYDPQLDVAVLRVPGLGAPSVTVSSVPVASGTTAATVGFPEGGPLTAAPAAVNARFQAVGLDIYGTSLTSRDVYELHAAVEPGDSGGPLVAAGTPAGTTVRDGTVIGVVFARSPSDPAVGYALTMAPVAAELAAAETQTAAVSTGACTP